MLQRVSPASSLPRGSVWNRMHAATERWANSSPGVAVDQSAVAARSAYAAGGGIMDGDTITSLVREHSSQPISRVDSELPAVLAAARTDRFVLRG